MSVVMICNINALAALIVTVFIIVLHKHVKSSGKDARVAVAK